MTQVLNPELYSALRRCYGKVHIVNPGEVCLGRWYRDPFSGEERFGRDTKGETYAVNCPCCGETRGRCYISYCCDLPIERLAGVNTLTWVKCYNADCFKDYENLKRMWEQIREGSWGSRRRPGAVEELVTGIDENNIAELPEWRRNENTHAPLPGDVRPINELPVFHPARQYLEVERGYDADALARDYEIGYVDRADEEYKTAAGRILIPVRWGGFLRAWQTRYVGTPSNKSTAKYFSLKGSGIARMLYDIDRARAFPWGVVVEGAPSVWRHGAPMVATFGSNLGPAQMELLEAHWPRGVVFMHDVDVFYKDGVVDEEKTLREETKRQERFLSLQRKIPRSFDFKLPRGTDPANYPPELLWKYLMEMARLHGWPTFEPPILRKGTA